MESFMENLLRFNFPTLTPSKVHCFSCRAHKIVESISMNDLVCEMEDFHASPKLGAQYFACIDCVYKTKTLVKYKKLLCHVQGQVRRAPMTEKCVDNLLHKLKAKRAKKIPRKQRAPVAKFGQTYKVTQLPKLPVLSVQLERVQVQERIGRQIKRKLDEDFVYSQKMSRPKKVKLPNGTTKQRMNGYKKPKAKPKVAKDKIQMKRPSLVVVLDKIDPALLSDDRDNYDDENNADENGISIQITDEERDETPPPPTPPLPCLFQIESPPVMAHKSILSPAKSSPRQLENTSPLHKKFQQLAIEFNSSEADVTTPRKSVSFCEKPPKRFEYPPEEAFEPDGLFSLEDVLTPSPDDSFESQESHEDETHEWINIIASTVESNGDILWHGHKKKRKKHKRKKKKNRRKFLVES